MLPQTKKPLDCPFCGPFPDRVYTLFSLGFQSLGICVHCIGRALDGWTKWRWYDGVCFRCNRAGPCYHTAPLKMSPAIGVCEHCLKAGQKIMNAPPLPPVAMRRLTQAEQSSGNN